MDNQNTQQQSPTPQVQNKQSINSFKKQVAASFEVLHKGLQLGQQKGAFSLEDSHTLQTHIILMKKYLE